jgi:hypothetical protein
MKPGGRLTRRAWLRTKAPLRRYTELRSTPRPTYGASGEGSAVSAIQPSSSTSTEWCAKRRPRTGHRVAENVRAAAKTRSGGWCEVQLTGCRGAASQLQHRITQKAGGRHGAAVKRSDRLSNVLHCCWWCHDVITKSPGASKQDGIGWSLEEWQEPSQEVVLYRGEPMYLDDGGSVHSYEEAGA